tara:strand:+ start:217 stop:1635 length:1419 start_codon:yes stop_codon:yes gene_type:complete
MSDLSIMMSGHISVPLYPNLNENTLNKILIHSETMVLFVGKLDNFDNIKEGIPEHVQCISYPFYTEDYPMWDDLIKDVEPIQENIVRDEMNIASIIYTSGTTGNPKGVMHKYFNFSFSTTNAVNALPLNNETFFSYLPLSHIAERLLIQMGSIYSGGRIFFAESLDTFSKDLSYASPTVFLGVPRIWMKFQEGILLKLPQNKLDFLLRIPIISNLIKRKIRKGLGLSNSDHIFTGAAPTPSSLILWFQRIGIIIQEAYAMTENTCYSHVSFKNKIKIGYVGQSLPLCQVKLSDIDEILIKHDALMDGYYKDDMETNETIRDGWLHTGDKGEIDSEGYLKITGRVKDIFKTSKGKYVSPSPIEMRLSENKHIGQVCLVGTSLPQPIALVILSEGSIDLSRSELKLSLINTLDIVNSRIDSHERVSSIVVLSQPWTIENKLLTPTMKIKRNDVEKLYKDQYLEWYDDDERILFY